MYTARLVVLRLRLACQRVNNVQVLRVRMEESPGIEMSAPQLSSLNDMIYDVLGYP